MLLYLNLSIKITASAKQTFRLQAVSEDDTIFVDFNRISSDMYTVSVGAGAVFVYHQG